MRAIHKTSAICSANPQGRKNVSRREVLRHRFESGEITTEELREYACFIAQARKSNPETLVERKPVAVITQIFGKEAKVSYREFEAYYKPLGFKSLQTLY